MQQKHRTFDVVERNAGFLRDFRVQPEQLIGGFFQRLQQGFAFFLVRIGKRIVDLPDIGRHERINLRNLLVLEPLFALNDDRYVAVGQRNHLDNVRHRANAVQIIGGGFVFLLIILRDHTDDAVAFVRLLNQPHGFLPSNRHRHDHSGKQHGIANGQNGKMFGYFVIHIVAFGRTKRNHFQTV